jgi:hypothetical protein
MPTTVPKYVLAGRNPDNSFMHNADAVGQSVTMVRGGTRVVVEFPNKFVPDRTAKGDTYGPEYQWSVVDADGRRDLINVSLRDGRHVGTKIRQCDKSSCEARKHAPGGKNEFLCKLLIGDAPTERVVAFTFADRWNKERVPMLLQAAAPCESASSDSDFDVEHLDGGDMFGGSSDEGEEEENGIDLEVSNGSDDEEEEEMDAEDVLFNQPHPDDLARVKSGSRDGGAALLEERSRKSVDAFSKYQTRLPPSAAPSAKAKVKAKTSSGAKHARDAPGDMPAAKVPRSVIPVAARRRKTSMGTHVTKQQPKEGKGAPPPAPLPAQPAAPQQPVDAAAFIARLESFVGSIRAGAEKGSSEAARLLQLIEGPLDEGFKPNDVYPIACNLLVHGYIAARAPSPPSPAFKVPW